MYHNLHANASCILQISTFLIAKACWSTAVCPPRMLHFSRDPISYPGMRWFVMQIRLPDLDQGPHGPFMLDTFNGFCPDPLISVRLCRQIDLFADIMLAPS